MRYFFLLASYFSVLLFSCTSSTKKSLTVFNKDSLITQAYTIAIDKDTTLRTNGGALLNIPKGALVTEDGKPASLEIKEAYSMATIIKARLTTQSNGELLSSGGMIYINAAGGQSIKITQPIKVSLPADYLSGEMQLYKGEETPEGIDWKEPTPLAANEQLAGIEKGKQIFQNNCSSCHAIGKQLTGPDLANFKRRFDGPSEGIWRVWKHNFIQPIIPIHYDFDIRRHDSLYKEAWFDPYICNLIALHGGTIGPLFPQITDEEWDNIYDYVQNESDRNNLPLPSHAYLDDCLDSCEAYNDAIKDLKEKQRAAESGRKKLIEDNGELTQVLPDSMNNPTGLNGIAGGASTNERLVTPNNYKAVYYQFTIESFGWYNIDVLMKDVDGVEESELFVRIRGEYRQKVNVFLIIPLHKVYGEGGPTGRNEDEYAFYSKDGKINLPQNATAYVLAVTETSESIAYSLKKFATARQQQFDLELTKATKEQFVAAMQEFEMDRLHIKVADSKNAEEIRKNDSELKTIQEQIREAEHLKPTGCDCDCSFGGDTTATIAEGHTE